MKRKVELRDMWVVHPFQHGHLDDCEAARAYATEAEAVAAAGEWATDVCYNSNTQHECVVFRAVASFRGRKSIGKFDVIAAKPSKEEAEE